MLAGLGQMGVQAFIIAGLSIVGSVVMVQLASGYIQKNLKAPETNENCKAGEKP